MIPTDLQPAEDVFPEVILDRTSQGKDLGRKARYTVGGSLPEVLATRVQAQFFARLVRGVNSDGIPVVNICVGDVRLVADAEIIVRNAALQARYWCIKRCACVPTGLVGANAGGAGSRREAAG